VLALLADIVKGETGAADTLAAFALLALVICACLTLSAKTFGQLISFLHYVGLALIAAVLLVL
jgi:hypothetical protein